jgi:hypothetical protein
MKKFNYQEQEANSDMIKHCLGEYKFSNKDIEVHLKSDDWRIRKFLFEKFFSNSTHIIEDLMIFKKGELFKLNKEYKVSQFNYEFQRKKYPSGVTMGNIVIADRGGSRSYNRINKLIESSFVRFVCIVSCKYNFALLNLENNNSLCR